MSGLMSHLVIGPILLPMVVAAVMLLIDERRRRLKSLMGLGTLVAVLVMAAALWVQSAGGALVYRLGDWAAPYGIVLVADRLSILMLGLTGVLAICALLFSLARWDRAGPRFQALFLLLIMGVNGALLTGDLFNLFVFFEIMLASSYGLALHGSGEARIRAGLAYIAVNLTASLLFLIGVAVIYGVTGTLNMADVALAVAQMDPANRPLLHLGAAVLGLAFLIKCAMWPLGFWLVPTYSAASAPAAAVFAILSKVGAYVVIRLSLLVFSPMAGPSAGFGQDLLLAGGLATVVFATAGLISSRELTRAAGYAVVLSSGTVLAVVGVGDIPTLGGALYYLIGSTLACGALFLVGEALERGRDPGAGGQPVFADEYQDPFEDLERNQPGLIIPAAVAGLGGAVFVCALMIAGLPPLAGFVGKLAIIDSLVARADVVAWVLIAALSASSLGALIGLSRMGIAAVWARDETRPPLVVGATEAFGIAALLGICILLTVFGGPALRETERTAGWLAEPGGYISAVLTGEGR